MPKGLRFSLVFLFVLGAVLSPLTTGYAWAESEKSKLFSQLQSLGRSVGQSQLPQVSAQSYLAFEINSGRVLGQKDAQAQRAPASLAKLCTALVALDHLELDQEVVVSAHAAGMEPSKMSLWAGETINVQALLDGLLIASANDAAIALSEAVASTEEEFVDLMNAKAAELGMSNTRFTNPTGFDHPDQVSTAYDLARLSWFAYQNQVIAEIVKQETKIVYDIHGYRHTLHSTNELIGQDRVQGIKTGQTDTAGQNLSLLIDENNIQSIIVLLGSSDRQQDGRILTDWIVDRYQMQQINLGSTGYDLLAALFGREQSDYRQQWRWQFVLTDFFAACL